MDCENLSTNFSGEIAITGLITSLAVLIQFVLTLIMIGLALQVPRSTQAYYLAIFIGLLVACVEIFFAGFFPHPSSTYSFWVLFIDTVYKSAQATACTLVGITFYQSANQRWSYTEHNKLIRIQDPLLLVLLLFLAVEVYSTGIFRFFEVPSSIGFSSVNSTNTQLLAVLLPSMTGAFKEEIIFRLGLQSLFLKLLIDFKYGYLIAVLISNLLWTLLHTGYTDPEWIKLLQVFPVGLCMALTFRKYGIEFAILLHVLLNLFGGITSYVS